MLDAMTPAQIRVMLPKQKASSEQIHRLGLKQLEKLTPEERAALKRQGVNGI